MEPERPSNNKKVIASFMLVLAVVMVAVGAKIYASKDEALTVAKSSQSASVSGGGTPASAAGNDSASMGNGMMSNGGFRDGTYSASGSYQTPESNEMIDVTITLKDGVVSDASVHQDPQNRESRQYQQSFANGYKRLVIGKKITDIRLSHVSGSSLTSEGFNNALQNIASQAKQS